MPPPESPAPPPAPTPRPAGSRRDVVLGAALIAAAVGVGAWLWTRPVVSTPRPPPETVILDRTLDLSGRSGDALRLRIARPCMLDVTIESLDAPAVIAFGPERPVEKEPRDVPDPDLATSWTAGGTPSAHPVAAFGPAMYVLRVDASPAPAKWSVRARVVERPWRGHPPGPAPER